MPSTSTPDGEPLRCPVCGEAIQVLPSRPAGDSVCGACGSFVWIDAVTGRLADLRPEVAQAIRRELDAVLRLSGASACDLVDGEGGALPAGRGLDGRLVASLWPYASALLRAVHRALDEPDAVFQTASPKEERTHLYFARVTPNALLFVRYDDGTTIGMIRLYALEATHAIRALLEP